VKLPRNVPKKVSRIAGVAWVTWRLPLPPTLKHAPQLDVYRLVVTYWLPGLRAFYQPDRHMQTNIAESLRWFWHADRYARLVQGELVEMATKDSRIASVRWVNYRLTENDKAALESEVLQMNVVLGDFAEMVYSGYRLSVSYDEYSKAMQASLVCGAVDNPDNGFGISARHPDLDTALRSLLYKSSKLGFRRWHEYADSPAPESWS